MSALLSCLPPELVRDLGWTLLHFLWQGIFLAAALNVILPLCRGAVARHNWALTTLGLMAIAPVATFLSLHDFASTKPAMGAENALPAGLALPAPAALPWIDWLVMFWLVGVALLSVRALGGWYVARSLMRRDTAALPDDVLKRCRQLQHRLAVNGAVAFLLSRRVRVPVVIGVLRPLILIPVSALTGLPPAQLDALILHELAHIRRLDTLTNILLVAVETILFYHPAVWWVGGKVRAEREHCCDDVAVSVCGNAGVYVEALTSLEVWKAAGALAANGGTLKARVARLLEAPADTRRFSLSALAGLTLLAAVAGSVATAQPAQKIDTNFTICVVDDGVDPNAPSGPPGDVRMAMIENGKRSYVWVKREGQLTNLLASAQASTVDGRAIIDVRLNPDGSRRFAAMSRANVGHRLAVIVNGLVITAPKVLDPMLGGRLQISGFQSEDDARRTALQMTATAAPAPSPKATPSGTPRGAGYPSTDKNPVMLRPIPGTHTLPPYPADSAHAAETGTVTLAVTIGSDGIPRKVAVAQSSGHAALDQRAADHVKNVWRWEPPSRKGKPITATTKVTVVFNLGPKARR